jgi:mono/diheme cytochrome c family protein
MGRRPVGLLIIALAWGLLGMPSERAVHGQSPHAGHGEPAGEAAKPAGPAEGQQPRRLTMEELHRAGGVPRGWRFMLPSGDPIKGKQIFADLECYKCHTVKDEGFPASSGEAGKVGPELTGMGAHHPVEYLAEAILAPNHVIVLGPGYTGADGLSIMPSFADSLSVTQWLDLVAYLKGLTAGGADAHGADVVRERVVGDYRLRLVFSAGPGQHGGASGGHSATHAPVAPGAHGHLMAFIVDREGEEPVPYLPVTAIVAAAGQPLQRVRLVPMVSDRGFHYGADVALPEQMQRITLSIGIANVQTTGSLRGRFRKPVSAVFDWGPAGH